MGAGVGLMILRSSTDFLGGHEVETGFVVRRGEREEGEERVGMLHGSCV